METNRLLQTRLTENNNSSLLDLPYPISHEEIEQIKNKKS